MFPAKKARALLQRQSGWFEGECTCIVQQQVQLKISSTPSGQRTCHFHLFQASRYPTFPQRC